MTLERKLSNCVQFQVSTPGYEDDEKKLASEFQLKQLLLKLLRSLFVYLIFDILLIYFI